MTFNLNLTGSGVVGFLNTANTIVSGWFGIAMLVALFIVTFYMCKAFQTKKGLPPALFLCIIEGIFFNYMGLINFQILFGIFGLMILSIILLYLQED